MDSEARQIVNALLEDDFDPEEVEQIAMTSTSPGGARDRIVQAVKDLVITARWHSPIELDVYAPHRVNGGLLQRIFHAFDGHVVGYALRDDDMGWRARYMFPRLRGYDIKGKVLPPIPA
jgi:hypothetical protein